MVRDARARCRAAHAVSRIGAGGEARPVFLKIAPDLDASDLSDAIETIGQHGDWLAGLIISNTTLDRPASLRSASASESGGLSGTPLFEKSTLVLKTVATELGDRFDLIGCGGISSGADAYAKIRAGAHAVQLYSALIYHGAGLVAKINAELAQCLKADGFSSVEAAIGADLPSRG